MGQNSSTPQPDQQAGGLTNPSSFPSPISTLEPTSASAPASGEGWPLPTQTMRDSASPFGRLGRNISINRRPVSVQATDTGISSSEERASMGQDAAAFESEERPLVGQNGSQLRDTSIPNTSISPTPRPRSMVSRVGARVRQRYSLLSTTNEESMETSQPTSDLVATSTSEHPSQGMFSATRRRMSTLVHYPRNSSRIRGQPTSRARFAPISRPILQYDDSELSPQFGVADALRRAPTPSVLTASQPEDLPRESVSARRRSRLSRVRQSISGPLENLFRSSLYEAGNDYQTQPLSRRSMRSGAADDSAYLIPPAASRDQNLDHEDHLSRASEATEMTPLESLDALIAGGTGPTLSATQERSEQTPAAGSDGREGRRLPNLLRGRSSRLIRRDDETPLSRILQVAAAAIAAQLSGTTDALANLEAMGEDHFDGHLNTFVEELSNASRQTPRPMRDNNEGNPLNFWRVFRFANNQETSNESLEQEDQPSVDATRIPGSRTITVVVVGVRSVPSSSLMRATGQRSETTGPRLDTLLNLPHLPRTSNTSGPGLGSGLLRSVAGRSRLSRRRTPANPSSTPSILRDPPPQRYGLTSLGPADLRLHQPSLFDHPSQSHHPPSNPLEPAIPETQSSDSNPSALTPTQEINEQSDNMSDNAEEPNGLRYRRRSDSEASRHRQNGARDSRRNGVVAPEGRSWLIYVVGTNLAEDHPALATDTIFSENPTYEDMINFTNALGPAKPPTASQEAVSSTNGVYVIQANNEDGTIQATPLDGATSLRLVASGACPVCLHGYAIGEQVRKIVKCDHMFHRDCVDTWLTGGRNSCPLCRGVGVEEKASEANGSENTDSAREIGRAI